MPPRYSMSVSMRYRTFKKKRFIQTIPPSWISRIHGQLLHSSSQVLRFGNRNIWPASARTHFEKLNPTMQMNALDNQDKSKQTVIWPVQYETHIETHGTDVAYGPLSGFCMNFIHSYGSQRQLIHCSITE